MALMYEFDASGEFLKIVVRGVMDDFEEAMTFSRACAKVNTDTQHRLVMVDESALEHKLSAKEMFSISAFIVEQILFVKRFAIVRNPERNLNPEYLKSFTSINNFSMQIFYDLSSAEQWLLN